MQLPAGGGRHGLFDFSLPSLGLEAVKLRVAIQRTAEARGESIGTEARLCDARSTQ